MDNRVVASSPLPRRRPYSISLALGMLTWLAPVSVALGTAPMSTPAATPAAPARPSLPTDRMLHPGDTFTGEVLDQTGFFMGWSLLPPDFLPGWATYGVTDWLSVETDVLNWLGGVPTLNLRLALLKPKDGNLAVAYETMALYLPKAINVVQGYKYLSITLQGLDWYHRAAITWRLTDSFRLHAALGVTYTRSLVLQNAHRRHDRRQAFRDLVDPACSLALDWRPLSFLSLHAGGSYGSTFTYLDNIGRKTQGAFSLRWAPFTWVDFVLLSAFRLETTLLAMYMHDVQEMFPMFPVVYAYWTMTFNRL